MSFGQPFQKGVSGNPRGRPKADFRLAELARAHTEAAINVLAEIMKDKSASKPARVSAATALLDRGYGRPPQFLTSDLGDYRAVTDLSDDELLTIVEQARAPGGSRRGAAKAKTGKKKSR